jgi:hypothetical protein
MYTLHVVHVSLLCVCVLTNFDELDPTRTERERERERERARTRAKERARERASERERESESVREPERARESERDIRTYGYTNACSNLQNTCIQV